jgi:hypothetical protein
VTLINMMTNPFSAHNGGASCLIKGVTYLGGVLGTWRRELSPWSLGRCDIYLGGWTLELEMLGLGSIVHGDW